MEYPSNPAGPYVPSSGPPPPAYGGPPKGDPYSNANAPPPDYALPPQGYVHPQGYPNLPPQKDGYPHPQGGGITTQPQNLQPVQPTVVIVGGCPSCGRGVLQDEYGCCAICLAICCFPVGVVCCLLMKEQKCSECGRVYGR